MNKTYHCLYHMWGCFAPLQSIDVLARTKKEAYLTALNNEIPKREGMKPEFCWVVSVTYSNGNRRVFETDKFKPY